MFDRVAAGLIVLVVLTLIIWFTYRIFRFLIVDIPKLAVSPTIAPIILSVLFALLLTPEVYAYATDVLSDILRLGSSVSASLSGVMAGEQLLADVGGKTLSEFVTTLINAFNVFSFPAAAFLWFVIVFAITYFVVLGVGKWLSTAPIGQSATSVGMQHPGTVQLSFLLIVAFSFYLSLSALLAIPLMKKEPLAQGFAQEDLEAAMTTAIGDAGTFAARYPDLTRDTESPLPATVTGNQLELINNARVATAGLAQKWVQIRTSAYAQIQSVTAQAAIAYSTANASRLGGREAVDHFGALMNWLQVQRVDNERRLAACLSASQEAIQDGQALVASVLAAPAVTADVEVNLRSDFEFQQRLFELDEVRRSSLRSAQVTCSLVVGTDRVSGQAPERESRSANLNVVGKWTAWLIETEYMPLVIIVGLVGFSLLGATISRIVRVGRDTGLQGLALTDLLIVIAGGAAAAMVVFVFSYGGLGILSEEASDPSPYVVFALCLFGAIFSEDVWVRGHSMLLARLNSSEGEIAKPGATKAKAAKTEAVEDEEAQAKVEAAEEVGPEPQEEQTNTLAGQADPVVEEIAEASADAEAPAQQASGQPETEKPPPTQL